MSNEITTGGKLVQSKQPSKPSITLPNASLTPQALCYDAKPSFDEWQAHGEFLRSCNGASMWWIGDWFVWGEQEFGEEAYQAVDGYDSETIRKAIWVSNNVTLDRRNPKLSWTHHSCIASCDAASQTKWLDAAQEHDLTQRELQASIKAGKLITQADLDARKAESVGDLLDLQLIFADPRWLRFKKQQWNNRHNLAPEQRLAWLEVLKEAAEMYETLRQEEEITT